MPDDRSKVGGQDRQRVNLHEQFELSYWTKKLGVTEEALRSAVAKVGNMADKVRQHLSKK